MGRHFPTFLALSALLVPAAASAATPPNDSPAAPAAFEPYTAQNGRPDEQQAVAELVEATGDAGVRSCLGPGSFARTVWYRVPEGAGAQRVTVEAMGRTLGVVDVAAFVQPEIPPPPPPPPPPGEPPPPTEPPPPRARTSQVAPGADANACSGLGAGAGDASE